MITLRTPTRINAATVLLFALIAVSFAAGCERAEIWQFTLKPHNGKASVDTDHVTLVFEGVALDHPTGGVGGGASGSLAVAGSGRSEITVTVDGKSFTNAYANGVNTLTFEGYTLKILDRGRKLQVAEQVIDLRGEKKTIVIREDGSAVVEEGEAGGRQ